MKQKTILKLKVKNPYIPSETKVLEFYRESPDNFTLTLEMKLKHDPGQFVQVSLPGIGECPISICSYSGEHLKLNVRQVGNMTNAMTRLKKGEKIWVRGPYGHGYPMKVLKGNNILMIGGGCGVAPLKGIIEYVEHNRDGYKDINLVFGFRSPNDILFQRESRDWTRKYKMVVSIDKDPHASDVAACYTGPVGFVTDILKGKGFHDDQIFISAERLMYCAIGKCCHCMIRGKFTCMDGPVFRYDEVKDFKND